jgi:hypothetical protein
MELNCEILKNALHELINGIGRKRVNAASITRASGIYNIQKMIDGKLTPMASSWDKLHKAFPDDIPEPTYTDGRVLCAGVNQGVNNTSVSLSIPVNEKNISDFDKETISLYLKYAPPQMRIDLREKLDKIAKIIEERY